MQASIAAYNESEEWTDQLFNYLSANYQAERTFFAENLPQLGVTTLEGTYLVWVDIRPLGIDSDTFTHLLLEHGKVLVNSGTMYGKETGEGFIRINIACPRSQLIEALERIHQVIKNLYNLKS